MRKPKKRYDSKSRRANQITEQYSSIRLCSSKKTQKQPDQVSLSQDREELLTSAPVGVVTFAQTATGVDAEVERIADSIFARFDAMFERLSK